MKITAEENYIIKRMYFGEKFYYRDEFGNWFDSEMTEVRHKNSFEKAYQKYINPKFEITEAEEYIALKIDDMWFHVKKNNPFTANYLAEKLNSLIRDE